MTTFAQRSLWMPRIFFLVALSIPLWSSSCTPGPRYVTCDNDAVCRDANEDFQYCSESHCVECVSNSQCHYGKICRAGACEAR
jgi:hypothetical protein